MPNQEMTEFGAGPRFAAFSAIICASMLAVTWYVPEISVIPVLPRFARVAFGAFLVFVGIPFYLLSLISVMRAFKAKQLLTRGTFGMCRHPVYAAWIVFFVPSAAMFINSLPLLMAGPAMYGVAVLLVKTEDSYLEEVFGQEYVSYRQKVPAFLPYGWFLRTP